MLPENLTDENGKTLLCKECIHESVCTYKGDYQDLIWNIERYVYLLKEDGYKCIHYNEGLSKIKP